MNIHVILVGSNPLPCYIGAAYLLGRDEIAVSQEKKWLPKPDWFLWVVTEETRKYCENINYILNMQYQKKYEGVHSDIVSLRDGRDAAEIEEKIINKICEVKEKRPVHILLNNTGGTKPMAVYSTVAVRKVAGAQIVECYIDPVKNKIRCRMANSKNEKHDFPKENDLRDIVKISLDQLVQMHYGKQVHIEATDYQKYGSEELCSQLINKRKIIEVAKQLLSSKEVYEEYTKFFKKCKNIKKIDVAKLQEVLEKNKKLLELFDREKIEEADRLIFARGDWLEIYFYSALLDARRSLEENIETAWSYKVRPNNGDKTFEIDVLALRGYELSYFSVSMAESNEQNMAKGKWFEAVYRAEQIAGEHGKVGIVNLMTEGLESFKKDLSSFKRDVDLYERDILNDYSLLVDTLKEHFSN